MAVCTIETLFAINVPHILERIFFSLDYESFKKCTEVCVAWSALLKSESFMTRATSRFPTEISTDENKLWNAANGGDIYWVRKLVLSGMVDVNCDGGHWEGVTTLCAASRNGNKSVVKMLLEGGAEVDKTDGAGRTPLFWAASYGNTDVGQLLLDSGAQPNKADEEGKTALHVAASRGHQGVVKLLLEWGAEYEKADSEGMTPLHLASSLGHWDQRTVVQLLLHKGADPNATDEKGRTPLHWAAFSGLKIVAQLLLDSQADPNWYDDEGVTPIQIASDQGEDDVLQVLLLKSPQAMTFPRLLQETSVHDSVQMDNTKTGSPSDISCLNPYPTVTSKSKRKKKIKERNKAEGSDQNPKLIPPSQEQNMETDPTKRLRNLRKRLRDTKALEAKLRNGEVKNPDPEQLEKVSRKSQVELEEDIRTLESVVAELSLATTDHE